MGTQLSAIHEVVEPPSSGPDTEPEVEPERRKTPKTKSMLKLSPKKLAKRITRPYQGQNQTMKNRSAEWLVNRLRRRGIPNVRLIKEQDRGVWTAWAPPITLATAPVTNKAADLVRRLISYLLADPPQPDPIPASSEPSVIQL